MIVDRSHVRWCAGCVILAVVACALYWLVAQFSPQDARGGSWQGMLFGVAGSACMVFAGLFSGKKAAPKWQIGTAQAWLRGHIWIGLLSVPLILCHCGFRWGGLLEQCLLVIFAIVIASGIFGVALQQYLPRLLTQAAPAQAIAPQVDVACRRLQLNTEQTIQKVCGPVFAEAAVDAGQEKENSPELRLARFYWKQAAPFLATDASREHPWVKSTAAEIQFTQLRSSVPETLASAVDALQLACNERRQLFAQTTIHTWLHGWLLLHVPLSVMLLILGILHAVMSVYY